MRSPFSRSHSRGLWLVVVCLVASVGISACTSVESSGDPALVVSVADDGIVIENQTGMPLTKGDISLMPQGIPRPYLAALSHLVNGQKRTIYFRNFRMSDATPFRRDVAKVKSIKVVATDVNGKTFQREVPFK
jgi:hypothetical protein